MIAEAVSVHRDQLRQRLVDDTTSISQCVLRDFDWQLKVKDVVLACWRNEGKKEQVE